VDFWLEIMPFQMQDRHGESPPRSLTASASSERRRPILAVFSLKGKSFPQKGDEHPEGIGL
jgi:hypothetical protein